MKRKLAALLAVMMLGLGTSSMTVFGQEDTADDPDDTGVSTTQTTNDDDNGDGAPELIQSLKPNILVTYYNYGGDYVTGGTEFELGFTLYNTSDSITVRNMVVKVNGGDVFTLSGGTDTIYIDSIAPDDYDHEFKKFTPSLNAATGSHPISLSISYEYYDNGAKAEGSAELSISVPVRQQDKIQLNNIGFGSNEIYVGDECDLNYSIINSGFTKIYNATAKLFDETGAEIGSVYLGNLEPGTETKSNGDLSAVFAEAGEKKLTFKLLYENEKIEPQELTQEVTANVTEYVDPFPTDMEEPIEEPVESGPSWVLFASIAAAVLVVGGVVTGLLIRRKRKQRSAFEDEDL